MFKAVKKFFAVTLTLTLLIPSFAFVASAAQKHSPKHPKTKQEIKKPVKKPVKK